MLKYIDVELLKKRCHITGSQVDNRHQCINLATLTELIDALAEEERMRIYLSGPITGVDNYLENFKAVEKRLKAAGLEVINPAAFNRVMPKWDTKNIWKSISVYWNFAMQFAC